MKILLTALLITLTAAVQTRAQETAVVASRQEQISYALGYKFGTDLQNQEADLDEGMLTRGILDAMSDSAPMLDEEEMGKLLMSFQMELRNKMARRMRLEGEKNLKEGQAYLQQNAEREGVQETESGLQYEVVKLGDGPKPAADSVVKVHYTGKLIDDTVFDSSVERGQPVTFPLNRVIPGWIEGLQLMPEGSSFRFFIPSSLAYGERGSPPRIGPHAVLVFDVELLDIQDEE